eukprot:265547_1
MSGWDWNTDNNNNDNNGWNWGANNNNNNCNSGLSSDWNLRPNENNNNSGFNWGNTKWDWAGKDATPWNYTIKHATDKTDKIIAIASKSDREYLVFGYGRIHNKLMPNDILTLCLNMFGLEGFSININYSHIRNTCYYQSSIFCGKYMNFQLILKTQEKHSSWDWGGSINDRLYFHVNIFQPESKSDTETQFQFKTAKIIALFTISSPQLNTQIHSMINTSFEMIEKNILIQQLADYSSCFRIQDLKICEKIEFIGNIEILHVDILDIKNNILNVFHGDIQMLKRVDYNWELNISLTP